MFHFFWRSLNWCAAGLCGAFFCWRHFWKRLRLFQAVVLGCREWVLPWGFSNAESFKTQTLGQVQITWLRLCPPLSAGGLFWFGRPACQRLDLKHWHVTGFFLLALFNIFFWVGNAFLRMRPFAARWPTGCERPCWTLLVARGFQSRGPERRATGFLWAFNVATGVPLCHGLCGHSATVRPQNILLLVFHLAGQWFCGCGNTRNWWSHRMLKTRKCVFHF